MTATRREDERLGAKYRVERTSDPTGKHEECGYFVLDPRHDPHAVTAIRAYSAAVRSERPGLADDLDAWVGAPVSDTRREDVAGAVRDAIDQSYTFEGDLDPDVDRRVTDAVLAVLPAPLVDDGGWTVADWEEWANEVAATLPEDCDGDEAQVEIIAKFVRRAAAPPVVDEETECGRCEQVRPISWTDDDLVTYCEECVNTIMTDLFTEIARLRGATRG